MHFLKFQPVTIHTLQTLNYDVFETDVQCLLVTKPQNAAALSGDVVSLSCASNSEDSVAWVAYSPGSSEREYIFGGRDLSPSASSYISISRQGRGHYSLHINATRRAAKRYICVEQGSTMTASAELIILGNVFSIHSV